MEYRLTGRIVHGQGKGRAVGMPTANLEIDEGQKLPPLGVYASIVLINEKRFRGVTNVGYRPSVDDEKRVTVETFVIDAHGDLYGKRMSLILVAYLRPTRKMANLKAVKAQVMEDARRSREILKRYFPPAF